MATAQKGAGLVAEPNLLLFWRISESNLARICISRSKATGGAAKGASNEGSGGRSALGVAGPPAGWLASRPERASSGRQYAAPPPIASPCGGGGGLRRSPMMIDIIIPARQQAGLCSHSSSV